jgi:hypothetical protein
MHPLVAVNLVQWCSTRAVWAVARCRCQNNVEGYAGAGVPSLVLAFAPHRLATSTLRPGQDKHAWIVWCVGLRPPLVGLWAACPTHPSVAASLVRLRRQRCEASARSCSILCLSSCALLHSPLAVAIRKHQLVG